MDLQHYTNDALIEILGLSITEDRFSHHRKVVEDELRNRLGCHAHNANIFSEYGVTPALTKTTEDFIKSFS